MRQLDLLRAGEKRRERAGKPERGVGSLGESGRFLYSGDRWRFGGSEVISLKVKNPPFSLFFFFVCLFFETGFLCIALAVLELTL